MTKSDYQKVLDHYKEISILGSIGSVLGYDIEAGIISSKGRAHRGLQRQLLGKLSHQYWNDKEFGDLIEKLHEKELDERESRNIELLYRRVKASRVIPSDLVQKFSMQANETNEAWKKAKKKQDYSLVRTEVEKLFNVVRERGEILAKTFGEDDAYSALISQNDVGINSKTLSKIFGEAKEFLVPTLKKVAEKHEGTNTSFLDAKVSREKKFKIAEEIADFYQFEHNGENSIGVIGEVTHPLTIRCGPKDVRVTANFNARYGQVMSSMQHELGHGLESLYKDLEETFEPVLTSGFPSIAEMNSRYTENKIGKSRAFWKYYYPKLQKHVPDLAGVSVDEFYSAYTRVEPGFQRMSADEVAYGLHVILRNELETELFNDQLGFDELNLVWNERYKNYMGIDVENDEKGILQDLHWYSYYWAYFQGYFLGDLFGSQVYHTMEKKIPEWKEQTIQGDFTPVIEFMRDDIFKLGSMYDPLETVEKITGKPYEISYFKKYINEKYLA